MWMIIYFCLLSTIDSFGFIAPPLTAIIIIMIGIRSDKTPLGF